MSLSVIVPIYNVEKYLEVCLESLINQTYQNLEIILVDDGSPDNCGFICDEYAKKDNRVKVIHKANGGLSDARNCGIKEASFPYVSFIDSDDYISLDMFDVLMKHLEDNDADISVCSYHSTPEEANDYINDDSNSDVLTYSGYEATRLLYKPEGKKIQFLAWNKIYKKELFINNDIMYPVGMLHEDMFTTYKLLYKANKVVVTTQPLYYYRQRSNSIMGVGFKKKNLVLFDATRASIGFYEELNEDELKSLAIDNHFRTLSKVMSSLWGNKEVAHLIKEVHSVFVNDCLNDRFKTVSLKSRTRKFFFRYIPWFASRVMKIKESIR